MRRGVTTIVAAFGTRLRVVPVDRADAVLDGEVVGYSALSVGFNLGANMDAYRVTIVVNIGFRDAGQNTVLWKEIGLTPTSDFSVRAVPRTRSPGSGQHRPGGRTAGAGASDRQRSAGRF